MITRKRSSSVDRLDHLAGWLFADLLLVLFLVGVGAQVTRTAAQPPAQETITIAKEEYDDLLVDKATLAELRKKYKILRKQNSVLSRKVMHKMPVCETIKVNADRLLRGGAAGAKYDVTLAGSIRRKLIGYKNASAAMVLIWGLSPDPDRGTTIAEQVRSPLRRSLVKTFEEAGLRPLWKGSGREGEVRLEMYFFGATKGPRC